MVTLDPADGYCTLINTFQVKPDVADRLLDSLHQAAATMRELPGFVSANLHISDDRKRVVNYVQWRTKADFETMLANPTAQPHMKEAADMAQSYEPVIYALRYSDE